LGYQEHRCVDDKTGIITATVTTDAAVYEAQMLESLLDEHTSNVQSSIQIAEADSYPNYFPS